jgi:hypothetical protein
MVNQKMRLDVHRLNEDDAAHKAALAKYLADGNKITQCVETRSPKRRRNPVHCKTTDGEPTGFIPQVRGRRASCAEAGYLPKVK